MLRVLCFGDSLTEGYTFQPDGTFYPYSKRLTELLRDSECCKEPVKVDTRGRSGERVITEMGTRLEKVLREAKEPYHWVLILGGTNDLGYGENPDRLLEVICQLHDKAKATGAKTMAMAIPQFVLELDQQYSDMRERKAKVNAGLKDYCDQSDSQSVFVDLYTKLPHAALSPEERQMYWCDALHMTPKGYDRMAEVIFSELKEHL